MTQFQTAMGSQTTGQVGEQDTQTAGPQAGTLGEAANEHFRNLHASLAGGSAPAGDDSPAGGRVDDTTVQDDTTSPGTTSSVDVDAMRLEESRNMARRFGVDEQVVSSFGSSAEAEAYLHGMRAVMSQAANSPQQYDPRSSQPPQGVAPQLPPLMTRALR